MLVQASTAQHSSSQCNAHTLLPSNSLLWSTLWHKAHSTGRPSQPKLPNTQQSSISITTHFFKVGSSSETNCWPHFSPRCLPKIFLRSSEVDGCSTHSFACSLVRSFARLPKDARAQVTVTHTSTQGHAHSNSPPTAWPALQYGHLQHKLEEDNNGVLPP